MENNINYNKLFLKQIDFIKDLPSKPKLLLHVCCGPCFCIPYELLKDYFDITLFFNNSNIYPKSEHDRRLKELKRYLDEIKANIDVIEVPYDNESYNKDLEPYKDEKEGGKRCVLCFQKRLSQAFNYASLHGFSYVGTVMSISRYKSAKDLNHIGLEISKEYPSIKWLFADFKKDNGYEKSLLIVKEHNMYFQEYCGCIYSRKRLENK